MQDSEMPHGCWQLSISSLGLCFLIQNSYMFQKKKKTLENSVGRIILLPGQLNLVKDLLNRKQNKKREDGRTMEKLLLGHV